MTEVKAFPNQPIDKLVRIFKKEFHLEKKVNVIVKIKAVQIIL